MFQASNNDRYSLSLNQTAKLEMNQMFNSLIINGFAAVNQQLKEQSLRLLTLFLSKISFECGAKCLCYL